MSIIPFRPCRPIRSVWLRLPGLALIALIGAPGAGADGGAAIDTAVGRSIYLEGRRADGSALIGLGAVGERLTGRDAACVRCHRRSGLGSVEGRIVIPPISGRALFGEGEPVIVRVDEQLDRGVWLPHPPLDAAAFAATLRDGHRPGAVDRPGPMPRFELDAGERDSLAAYLRGLSTESGPGVSSREIHLATVIAPDVAPERRAAFAATLSAAVEQINAGIASGRRQKIDIVERRLETRRRWTLEIREPQGPPAAWGEQLDRMQATRPAFAILSGLGGADWTPIQSFCERTRIACWFPSVDLPPAGPDPLYSLYFSRGLALEAAAIAQAAGARPEAGGRLYQVIEPGVPLAKAAAALLRDAESAAGQPAPQALTLEAWLGLPTRASDRVVLWLGAQGLAHLPDAPTGAARLIVSARLAGDEASLPPAWRGLGLRVQASETRPLRDANLRRFRAWRASRKLPDFDERMQSEVFFAANALATSLRSMLNNLHPDYLIERAEDGLSMREAMQVQEEVQALQMATAVKRLPGSQAAAAAETRASAAQADFNLQLERGGTTVYPRLSLGSGQRYAAKGAYLVPLAGGRGPTGAEWVLP